jgi:hypothetical protein
MIWRNAISEGRMAKTRTFPDSAIEILAPGSRIPGMDDAGAVALLRQLDALEQLLDRRFRIAGIPLGLDSIIGLIPVVGDTVTAGMSGWIIWQAHRLGAPDSLKARMAANVAIDYAIGLVPLAGDLGDAFFKANTRNVRLLRKYLHEKHGVARV